MIGEPGPFLVVECNGTGAVDRPIQPPLRRYSCSHYSICLNLAAALNWDSFTCRGCCGAVNESLCWRARHAQKRDRIASQICTIPEIVLLEPCQDPDEKVVSVMGKR